MSPIFLAPFVGPAAAATALLMLLAATFHALNALAHPDSRNGESAE